MRGDNPLPDLFREANLPRLPRGAFLVGLLVLLGLIIVFSMFYTVEADEVAAVQRFGKYVRQEAPGLHFRLPLGLETVRKVKVRRVLKAEFGFRTEEPGVRTRFSPQAFPEEALMLTGDLNVGDVKWIVQYRIADPAQYLFGNRSPERALNDVAQIVMRTVVGDHTVTEVFTERRTEIAHEVQRKMQKLLELYATGLRVETVNLQNVTPPSDAVKRAFNEVNEAQQEKERKINEALQAYNQEVPSARGEAERTLAQAAGYAIQRVNNAKGDVARFTVLLAEYHKAPGVTRRRLYLETMRDVLPAVRQIFVFDSDQSASFLPFLDLQHGSPLPVAPTEKEGAERPLRPHSGAEEGARRPLRPHRLFAPVVLVVFVVGIIVSGALYRVDEMEQVIITKFGRLVGEPITTPGLHVKMPFVQTGRRVDKRILEWEGSPDQIPTLDKWFILVDTTARWRIVDPLLFFQAVGDERSAQSRLDDVIDSAARDVVSSHRLIQVVRNFERDLPLQDLEEAATIESRSSDTGETKAETAALPSVAEAAAPGERLGRDMITGLMVKRAQPRLAELGIELVDVRIKRINYVREVEQKVFERMVSERRRIAARFRSEGDGASAKIRGDKERELDRIRSEAYRQAQESIGKADAEAAAIYATAYGQDAEFYSFLQTLETYKQTLQKNSSLVLTTDSDYYRYLKNGVYNGEEPASSTSSRR